MTAKEIKWFLFAAVAGAFLTAQAQIEAVWLTHRSAHPDKTVVSWKSARAGPSRVLYGANSACDQVASVVGERVLHHVEINTPRRGATVFYRVVSGDQRSETLRFQTCPEDDVRVAIVGDWGYARKPDLKALKADKPHMLITVGDNVAHIINPKQAGDKTYIQPFLKMLKSEADFFASTLFMPILGNHDKQVGARVNKRPGASSETYDIDATAYLSVFALPDPGWRWSFTIPQADVTFLALDMHHLADRGTTFQASHDHLRGSAQFKWYDEQTRNLKTGFAVTLMNATSRCRSHEEGAWHEMFSRGTINVTGYGYYAERAVESNGFPYYNSCVAQPNGYVFRDPRAVVCEPTASYMLLTFDGVKERMKVDLKRLDGSMIDTQIYQKKAPACRSCSR